MGNKDDQIAGLRAANAELAQDLSTCREVLIGMDGIVASLRKELATLREWHAQITVSSPWAILSQQNAEEQEGGHKRG